MKKLKRLYLNAKFRKLSSVMAAGAGLMAIAPQVQAQTVVSDSFANSSSNQYGLALNGGTPNGTNLPGGSYFNTGFNQAQAVGYNDSGYVNPSGNPGLATYYAGFNNGGGTNVDGGFDQGYGGGGGLSLGSYNTGSLAVTGNVLGYTAAYNTGSNNTPDLTTAYLGVGFTSLTTGSAYSNSDPRSNFTGLVANGNGSLQEYVNGIAVGSAIAFGGTYSSTTAEALTYDINTATGAITDVSFGSSTATYDFSAPSTWSNSYTASAEIMGSGGIYDQSSPGSENAQAQLGSFSISEAATTPEPSSYALLAGGLVALGAMQQLRRRDKAA